MIRTNQHRHNLDTRAHEALQPTRTRPAHEFEDWMRRQEQDEEHRKASSDGHAEMTAMVQLGQPQTLPAGPEPEVPEASAWLLETPTPAAAATAQAHLRMSLPLAPESQAWTFDLSASNLPVQSLTLSKASNGQLNLSIQSNGSQSGQQMEAHLPRLKQRLSDKVANVDIRADGDRYEQDDGSVAT